MDKRETFGNIGGRHFQESLCQIMLEDRPFCDQLMEVLEIDFFESVDIQKDFHKSLVLTKSLYEFLDHDPLHVFVVLESEQDLHLHTYST